MKKKAFKSESKKLLNLMINSIYTNKDIFLRELISNASDALDKIYFQSLTDKKIKLKKKDLKIKVSIDKDKRTLTISDNGCGMTEVELEHNLGTIAESGSDVFKQINKNKDINIIGQFGVGFYSVFMVADQVDVNSKPYNSNDSYLWSSTGEDGYTIQKSNKTIAGTDIVIKIKDGSEEYNYSQYLDEYKIEELIKKYSNYIHYPIKMEMTHQHLKEGTTDEYEEHKEEKVLNNIQPIWKKDKKKLKQEDYDNFYMTTYYDYEKPLSTIKYDTEGTCSFTSLLFIPSHAPYDLYSKEYKRGLQLYSNGVLIMDKCEDLLPDYYGFVKGLVDSEDISLNISREMLQKDHQLKIIAKNVAKKINKELVSILEKERDKYEQFFKEFGSQLKIGIYNNFGANKDELQDLLLFHSSKNNKYITLKEYINNLKENQDNIYYAVGESIAKIDLMPQVEEVKDHGYEVLYLTDYADEFVIQVLQDYEGKKFKNVTSADLNLEDNDMKETIEKINEENQGLLDKIKTSLNGEVSKVKFTANLKKHPVCLTTEGNISTNMERVLNSLPTNGEKVKAETVLLINHNHPIAKKIEEIHHHNPNELDKYAKVLYAEARLIEGLNIDNPSEISDLVCELLSK